MKKKKKKKTSKKGCAGFLLFLILAAGLAALVYLMQKGELDLPALTFPSDSTTAETKGEAQITFPSLDDDTNALTDPRETDTYPLNTKGTDTPPLDTSKANDITDVQTNDPASGTTNVDNGTNTTTPEETTSDATTTPETEPAKIEIVWEPDGMSENHDFDGETVYCSTINRPVFSGGRVDATKKINTTLKAFCEGFIKLTSEDKLLAEEAYENARFDYEPYERSGDCTVYVKDNVLSVLFHLYRNTGGADTVDEYKAFVFDLATGAQLSFADYIGKDFVFGTEYITSVFSQLIDHSPRDFYSDALDILRSTVSLNDFYLTEEALILFYNPGTLASSAQGVLTVEVPYSKIGK